MGTAFRSRAALIEICFRRLLSNDSEASTPSWIQPPAGPWNPTKMKTRNKLCESSTCVRLDFTGILNVPLILAAGNDVSEV